MEFFGIAGGHNRLHHVARHCLVLEDVGQIDDFPGCQDSVGIVTGKPENSI